MKEKEPKKILDKATILNIEGAKNTKSETRTLGEVELKYVSLDDYIHIMEHLKKIKDGREFTAQVIHHQMIRPEISLEKFLGVPDNELQKLARDYVAKEDWLFKYFNETTDPEFFINFRKAIEERHSKVAELLKSKLEPLIRSAKRTLDTFHRQYPHIHALRMQLPSLKIDLGTSLSNFFRQLEKSQLRIAESVASVVRQWESSIRTISEALSPQIELWQKWLEKNRSIFQNIAIYLEEFERLYRITEKEAVRILRKHKWLITPSLPANFLYHVVRIGKRRGNQRGAINSLFVEYFLADECKNLEILVDSWKGNPLFQPRLKILRDCVSVIKEADGKFNPSNFVLPTLIAQIDGIRIEFMDRNGINFWVKDKKWKPLFKVKTSNDIILDLAGDIFLDILFQKSVHAAPLQIPFVFNRHKILHGEYKKYGRIDNTIRAFLVLDFLACLKLNKKRYNHIGQEVSGL